jgi:hypothetical protein
MFNLSLLCVIMVIALSDYFHSEHNTSQFSLTTKVVPIFVVVYKLCLLGIESKYVRKIT